MTDTPESPKKPTALDRGKQALETADRAATVVESASNAFGAIKWVAIAVVTLTFAGGGFAIYKAVSAPAKAIGNAAGTVTESVKTGAGKIKDSGADVINRLEIPTSDQAALNSLSEAAFKALTTMAATDPEGMKDRLYRRTHFGGHDGRICKLNITTQTLSIPVTLAADNESYATAKALGSNDNRLIRMVLTAGDDDVALRSEWDEEAKAWVMRWKATTMKKAVGDAVAQERLMDVLKAAAAGCK
ncbi:MAG: hypothetical protein ABJN69_13615 [Hellea sp.]